MLFLRMGTLLQDLLLSAAENRGQDGPSSFFQLSPAPEVLRGSAGHRECDVVGLGCDG